MILPTAARNAMVKALTDLIDAGAGPGTLVFETSGDVEVATLTFSSTAFGLPSSGTGTAAAITSDTSATGGTVAQASIYDSDANKCIELSVGTSGTDIVISSTTIGAGSTVACSSLTFTMPAS